MNQDDFMTDRVNDQISWYDKKSRSNQKWYKILRITEIILAAAIPFLAGYISEDILVIKIIIGLLGVIIAIVAAIIGLFQFQENWVEYRTTCESLKHEKYLFMTKAEPYNIDEAFQLFVKRIESLISSENTKWSQYIKSRKKERKNG